MIQDDGYKSFLDPVNFQPFTEPIMCPHGHTFEKNTLLRKEKMMQCAFTGEYFPESEYRPNFIVRDLTKLIQEFEAEKLEMGELSKLFRESKDQAELYKNSIEQYKKALDNRDKELIQLRSEFDKKIEDLRNQLPKQFLKEEDKNFFTHFIVGIAAVSYFSYRFFFQSPRTKNELDN